MKKALLASAVVLGTLGFGSLASAQWVYHGAPQNQHNMPAQVGPNGYYPDTQAGGHSVGGIMTLPRQIHEQQSQVLSNVPNWAVGRDFRDHRDYRAVRNWRRLGLSRPPAGHQWIDYGNNYALMQIASGAIVQYMAK
jgi:Ni/Co efflux regulator RcnB